MDTGPGTGPGTGTGTGPGAGTGTGTGSARAVGELAASSGTKRPAVPPPAATSKSKKPTSVLSLVSSRKSSAPPVVANADPTDPVEVVKAEEAKYATLCDALQLDNSAFCESNGLFKQTAWWAQQKAALPIHYSLWAGEVGPAKCRRSAHVGHAA